MIEGVNGALGAQFLSDRHPDPESSRSVLAKGSRGFPKIGKTFRFTSPDQVRKAVGIVLGTSTGDPGFADVFDRAAARVRPRQPSPSVAKSNRPALAGLVADLRRRGPA